MTMSAMSFHVHLVNILNALNIESGMSLMCAVMMCVQIMMFLMF